MVKSVVCVWVVVCVVLLVVAGCGSPRVEDRVDPREGLGDG